MKNILTTIFILMMSYSFAQVAIGKSNVEGSALIDFEEGTTKGLILPVTENTSGVAGTLTFDKTSKKVMFKDNTGWIPMNTTEGIIPTNYDPNAREIGSSVIIGASEVASDVDGVLILESTDKAMVLPKIANPHLTVKSPSPGMICYDPTSKSFAVFNGIEWSYWK